MSQYIQHFNDQSDYTLGQSFLMLQWKILSNFTSDEMLLNKKMLLKKNTDCSDSLDNKNDNNNDNLMIQTGVSSKQFKPL